MAFTDFGIENLIDLIKIHKDNAARLKRSDGDKSDFPHTDQNPVCDCPRHRMGCECGRGRNPASVGL